MKEQRQYMHTQLPRRAALKFLAAAATLPALTLQTRAAPGERIWKTAIGLNGFSSGARKYKKNYPIWEVLDFAARQGFDGVELVDGWPSGPYPAATEKERIRALRRLYDSYGLRIFSIQTGAGGASDPDPEARRRWLDEFRDHAQFAKEVGCEHIGLWPGGGLKDRTIDEAIATLADSLHRAGEIADSLGLIAAFEIEPVFIFNKEDHYQRILRQANHPALKGIYDPSHFDWMNGSTGKPEEMLLRVGIKNIGYVQFCDTDGTLRDGATTKHLGCGDGHMDCMKSLQILKDGGYRGWIMVDAWEVPDPYDACTKCKRLFEQVMR